MLKLSSFFDSVRFILLKMWTEWAINCYILCHFKFLTIKNTTVGGGAASRYGSSSDQMMPLRLRNTAYNSSRLRVECVPIEWWHAAPFSANFSALPVASMGGANWQTQHTGQIVILQTQSNIYKYIMCMSCTHPVTGDIDCKKFTLKKRAFAHLDRYLSKI
jgi:hypothetical protein